MAADGGVFAYGDAGFFGSAATMALSAPVVGMAATSDGLGYWLVGSDGSILPFGDAIPHGSLPSLHVTPARPVVGMAATPDGGGWLVGADGGVYAFGDARFAGSMGGTALNRPVVGMADGAGYWPGRRRRRGLRLRRRSIPGFGRGTHLAAPVVGIDAGS